MANESLWYKLERMDKLPCWAPWSELVKMPKMIGQIYELAVSLRVSRALDLEATLII